MSDAQEKVITPKTVKKETVKEVPKEPETVIYIGPELPGVKRYTVFNNGLPSDLKEQIEKKPVLGSLIVPVERLARANAELAKPGSALHVLYDRACE